MVFDLKMETENSGGKELRNSGRRKFGFVVIGLSLGGLLAYWLTGKTSRGRSRLGVDEYAVDDRGTGQKEASRILRKLRDRAFEASDERLALALGRPVEEVQAWNAGQEVIDDDVIMKARGIAMHRGIRVE